MPQHMVICVNCGKQFDANKGGAYDPDAKRYTCKACAKEKAAAVKAFAKEKAAAKREAATGMKQSKAAMIVKIVFGALFILSAPSVNGFTEVLIALAIGAALIAWAVVPFWKGRRELKRREAEKTAAETFTANLTKVCPRCGATTKGAKCEYCGSPLE